uniref:Uncharacterized protein n=1 Tax=Rhizophora mucronata TaxID=61149 RepID=A0A2P2IJZ8_RHIMU
MGLYRRKSCNLPFSETARSRTYLQTGYLIFLMSTAMGILNLENLSNH